MLWTTVRKATAVFVKNDESGLTEIIRDYKDGLIFFLLSFTGNLSIAEEAAEDTFVILATRKPYGRRRGSFKTWLYVIGRNAAIDHLRKNNKHCAVPSDYTEIPNSELDLFAEYLKEERKIILLRSLQKLKAEYKQVLWLIYFEDLSQRETAAVMKNSLHTTETLVYRARATLKSSLRRRALLMKTYKEMAKAFLRK